MRTARSITIGAAAAIGAIASAALAGQSLLPGVYGTIWVANRGTHSIRGFDARTGDIVATVPMAAGSQPGDLAYAKGKIYVAEEFGTPPAVAVVDAQSHDVLYRLSLAGGARPHHVHASPNGDLIAVGLYGTDMVAVVDTLTDLLLGPWDTDPAATNARVHAGVFSQDSSTLYLASDATGEVIAIDPRNGFVFWRMSVPGAHELAILHDGKTAYVSRRTANKLAMIDLLNQTYRDVLDLDLPDTLRLSADERLLTVGLRMPPARLAVIDTATLHTDLVTLSAPGETTTIAGHQWTSESGRYTFAAFEGGANPGVAVIDHFDENRVVQRLPYPGRPHGVSQAIP
jgi:hypothetical protein